jgi:predicted ribosome quality control (RQC) complex YloA/Tae2 family protein
MAEKSHLPQRLKILAWLQIPLIGVAVAIYAFILWNVPHLLQHQSNLNKSIEQSQETEARLEQAITQLQATKDEKEKTVAQLEATINVISPLVPQQQLESAITSAPQNIISNIPPRIYVQIPAEDKRTIAELASTKLRSAGFVVPGIEDVGLKKSPNLTEIRYFASDQQVAHDLKEIEQTLSEAGIPAVPKYIAPTSSSKIRPRHFELWFAENTSAA